MNRKKLFIENIFSYGLISILDRIVPFLLLPVITRLLPSVSDYGVFNMFTTIVGFGTPLAILGLYDAMFREYYEKESQEYKYNVTTTTQRMILCSSVIVSIMLILFSETFSVLFFGNSNHGDIIVYASIAIFLGANKSPIQGPTRLQNQRSVYAVTGILSSVINYILSIILINLGYSYYGMIFSNIVASCVIIIYFWKKNKIFFIKGSFDKKIARELLKVGIPLLPTFLIYWIYNSMDKIMISNLLGTSEVGLYSIGSKTAQISQLIYAGFAGGFSYFKYKTMKDSDQVQMNSKLFEYGSLISFSVFILIYPFSEIIFKIMYEGIYEQGYVVFPYLFLSPLLLMLFQIVGSQFIVVKKSYLTTSSLLVGAVINLLLNYWLIPIYGIEGAAIATVIGYLVSVIIVVYVALKSKLLIINFNIIIIPFITLLLTIVNKSVFNNNFLVNMSLSVMCLIIFFIIYYKEIKKILFGTTGE